MHLRPKAFVFAFVTIAVTLAVVIPVARTAQNDDQISDQISDQIFDYETCENQQDLVCHQIHDQPLHCTVSWRVDAFYAVDQNKTAYYPLIAATRNDTQLVEFFANPFWDAIHGVGATNPCIQAYVLRAEKRDVFSERHLDHNLITFWGTAGFPTFQPSSDYFDTNYLYALNMEDDTDIECPTVNGVKLQPKQTNYYRLFAPADSDPFFLSNEYPRDFEIDGKSTFLGVAALLAILSGVDVPECDNLAFDLQFASAEQPFSWPSFIDNCFSKIPGYNFTLIQDRNMTFCFPT